MEFPRRSVTAGIITARLTWQQIRLDLDLVLNNGAGMNFRQSIAANRCCETVEFFVNGGTDYAFVVYLRGVDPQFLANGGIYTGEVATPFTLEVERPE
jgi:cobalamin biosynthesis Mg chelatase CobN